MAQGCLERAIEDRSMAKGDCAEYFFEKMVSHDPKKWNAFRSRYELELKSSKEVDKVIQLLKRNKVVTLVYSAKDEDHNQAIVLRDFLAANGR